MISVVIPAYNEERVIGKLLKSLKDTGYKDYEVIVVDDGSTDNTSKIARRLGARVIRGPHRGVGIARNIGWKVAKGDIIVFLDADMEVKKDFFEKLVAWFEKGYDAIDFVNILKNKDRILARLSFIRYKMYLGKLPFVRAVKKKVLEDVGGYNPEYGHYDDWELALRVKDKGYKVAISDIKVFTYEPETFTEVFRKARWEGRSIPSFLKRHKIRFLKAYGYALLNFLAIFPPITLVWFFVEMYRSALGFKKSGMIDSLCIPFFDWFTGCIMFVYATIGLFKREIGKA